MFIKQISVFLENHLGALRELTALLASANLDIRELSVADTQNFGIIRMILRSDAMDHAMTVLKENGYTARMNHVICAEIDDKAGGLCRLLTVLEDAKLSVEYMYSFRRTSAEKVLMVLRLSEQEKGLALLKEAGFSIHSQEETDRL